jgi:uncharacterized protein
MAPSKLLLACGGDFHDFRGVSAEMQAALTDGEDLVDVALDDLDVLVSLPDSGYHALVFYHTLGTLTPAQETGLISYVTAGGGFVGVHSAADSFRDSPAYHALVGGHFIEHPQYRPYQVRIVPGHEITAGLDTDHFVEDEMYVTSYDSRVQVLATALWGAGITPVAWCHNWGNGRVFYLALGHDAQACRHRVFTELLRRGTRWACRNGQATHDIATAAKDEE